MLPCVATRTNPVSHLLLEWEAFAQLSTDCPAGSSRTIIGGNKSIGMSESPAKI
jgi:hypothetical protein